MLFIGTSKGERRATLQIANDAGKPVVLRLVGAVGIAKLTVQPRSGPPGIVVIATGTGFPPNAPVALRWSIGITATPLEPTVSDATGAFTAQVLVLPRDRVGERTLRAVADRARRQGGPGDGPIPRGDADGPAADQRPRAGLRGSAGRADHPAPLIRAAGRRAAGPRRRSAPPVRAPGYASVRARRVQWATIGLT